MIIELRMFISSIFVSFLTPSDVPLGVSCYDTYFSKKLIFLSLENISIFVIVMRIITCFLLAVRIKSLEYEMSL